MQVYLLRHAVAAPRNARRFPHDPDRPLTREGRAKLATAARGMRAMGLTFDLVLTSPLKRARQTAGIVTHALRRRPRTQLLRSLSPTGGCEVTTEAIQRLTGVRRLLLVGHEPDLSRLAAFLLLGGDLVLPIEFKKGGLCRMDFDGGVHPGAARLAFHLTPRFLRMMARLRP